MKAKSVAEFVVYCGPMASAKTTKLIMDLERYDRRGMRVVAFKPRADDRYAVADIVTHDGRTYPAVAIDDAPGILAHLASIDETVDVVGIDELFMLEGAGDLAFWLLQQGVTVIAATLDMSFNTKTFKEAERAMSHATKIEKLTAVCAACGKDARYSYRKVTDVDTEMLVGGMDTYEPRCAECHPVMNGALE